MRIKSLQNTSELLLIIACVGTFASNSINGQIVAFLPLTCRQPDTLNATVTSSVASNQISYQNVTISLSLYDSCIDSIAFFDLVDILFKKVRSTFTVIGPYNSLLCSSFGNLASIHNIPIVSWNCQSGSNIRYQKLPMMLNVGPSGKDAAAFMVNLLYYFQWQYVSILSSSVDPYRDQATEINFAINVVSVLGVFEFMEVTTGLSLSDAKVKLNLIKMHGKSKALILVMPINDASTILKAVVNVGMANGDYAILVVDVFEPLLLSSRGTLINEFLAFENETSENSAVSTALQVTMIIKCHSESLLLPNGSFDSNFINKYSMYHEYLYNAISLIYESIKLTIHRNQSLDNGSNIIESASLLTFVALHDTVTTNMHGDISMMYSLWDFSPHENSFSLVLQSSNGTEYIQKSNEEIMWPNDRSPQADICAFSVCDERRTPVAAIVSPSILGPVAIVASIVLVLYCRWRLFMKELKQGPAKLLIIPEDVVFVSPRSLSQSKGSLSEKSSLIDRRRSGIGRSNGRTSASLGTLKEVSDATNLARFNGDIVFLKRILIKGFEVSSKMRGYLKSLRDMRHENLNPFIGCYIDPVSPALIYEYCARRSLEDVIYNEDIKLDWEFKLSLLTDLVMGMRYLHLSPVRVHGNLKSSNCVIDSRWVLKITDVGVKGIYERHRTNKLLYSEKELLWTAPELLRNDELFRKGTQKADVYSFAIICQEVILRCRPFSMLDRDAEEIIQKIRKPPPLCRPSVSQGAAPPEYIQMMKQCWTEQPDMRPVFDDIVSRFKSINKGRKVNIVDTMFRMLEKYSTDLEEIVRIRTLALEDERKKTENLLTQMLPTSVAKSLLMGSSVDPETYDEVTIYFSDIVGFTTISAMSTPLQVVQLLNDLYTVFDSTIDDYDVYKVETIGDAYMVCSGLPARNGDKHAGEISTLALDILSKCGQFEIRHMPELPLRIRIGLHTGSCVAGVVGLRMPRYCLFGDTVNTASRMESTGTAFRIHISSTTRDKLIYLGGYYIQSRGEVELKGKGMHNTYWLVGKIGFTKPLPEPPAQIGEDNHGIAAYVVSNQDRGSKNFGINDTNES